ncbi:hypothetical protein H920_03378 [Fukomys damarensis]|uniref:Uncharacterized protein n=1 Tax=Fukomys damarensis TaxID=885580 RepID=A0A091DXS3_FUKDA|nr:hypothetical protein H920_03378 [Fukomys damarensis]
MRGEGKGASPRWATGEPREELPLLAGRSATRESPFPVLLALCTGYVPEGFCIKSNHMPDLGCCQQTQEPSLADSTGPTHTFGNGSTPLVGLASKMIKTEHLSPVLQAAVRIPPYPCSWLVVEEGRRLLILEINTERYKALDNKYTSTIRSTLLLLSSSWFVGLSRKHDLWEIQNV